MMVHVKKNFGVSLNDKDKLDKWTKCQAVIDYGGKIAFMVLCNCVNFLVGQCQTSASPEFGKHL